MSLSSWKFFIPLGGFIVLVIFLAVGLFLDPRKIPSPLVGQPVPNFELTQLNRDDKASSPKLFSPSAMRGKLWMLNIWASWCVSCRTEHAALISLSQPQSGNALFPIIGLNYKEVRGDSSIKTPTDAESEMTLAQERANTWLNKFGDPYLLTIMDNDGRAGIDFGLYGVPESYLIDSKGIIRFKQIGPITSKILEQTILPLARKILDEKNL